MPSIKRKICSKHGVYTTKSCELCKSENNKISNLTIEQQKQKKVYNKRTWRGSGNKIGIAKEVLIRDGFQCVMCGKVIGIKPNDHAIDHIIEIADGGSHYDKNNLQSLCASCHNKKGKSK